MITKEQLAEGYALNLRLVKMHTAGLSHADSLILSPYNINCLNWVVGHIAVGRDSVMRLGMPDCWAARLTAFWMALGCRWWRRTWPLSGSVERCEAGKTNCQGHSLLALGYLTLKA